VSATRGCRLAKIAPDKLAEAYERTPRCPLAAGDRPEVLSSTSSKCFSTDAEKRYEALGLL